MKSLPTACCALLALAPLAGSQTWQFQFDGATAGLDRFVDSELLPDGSLVLAGTLGTGVAADFELVRVDPAGQEVWSRVIDGGGQSEDLLYGLASDAAGDVYFTGRSASGSTDFYTVKLRGADGATLWSNRSNGAAGSIDQPADLVVNAAGEVFVTGFSYNSTADADYWTLKLDAAGNRVWDQRYSGPGPTLFAHDHARDLALDPQGDIVVTGFSSDATGHEDYFTIKYRGSDGARLWQRRYTGAGANDVAQRVVVDGAGDVYVAGESYQGGYTVTTVKYRGSTGNVRWTASDTRAGRLQLEDLRLADDGALYLAIASDPDFDQSNINGDVLVSRRATGDGSLVWRSIVGAAGYNDSESPSALAFTAEGQVLVSGGRQTSGSFIDALLLRLDPADGSLDSLAAWDSGIGETADTGRRVHVRDDGTILLSGSTPGAGLTSDLMVLAITDHDLFLTADSTVVHPGWDQWLEISPGTPGSPPLLVLTAVDGVPTFTPLLPSSLDARGRRRIDATIPPGLSGLRLDLLALARSLAGRFVATKPRPIEFR